MVNRTTVQAMTVCVMMLAFLAPAGAADVTYTAVIKPLFEAHCAGCHGKDSPEYPEFNKDKKKYAELSRGPRMDSYTYLVSFTAWPDTGSLMRRLDDGKGAKDGKPGNMLQYLGASDEERLKNLGLFKAWVGNWTLKRWPEITKEELNGIKVPF
ncbi:MAG TPA: hypothetical protein VN260_07085 [Dissulfurispiraceae bacterium]|nr:hypothetical protein [Dissulfurispiraceae bacterium]